MLPLTFRTAREDDLDRLVEIHTSAFPDPRGVEPRQRNFARNPLGPLDALHVALRGDAIVAHAFLFAFDVGFGGRNVRVGAIASVGVAPESRGEGIGGALLDHLHAASEARGDAITLLYPFRQAFYARHGYAPVTASRRLAIHPASIPRAWSTSALAFRVAGGADRDPLIAAYRRVLVRATGLVDRPEALWDRLFHDERRVWLVASRGSSIAGYIAWSLEQAEAHAATRLVVHEVIAEDDHVRRALLGKLGSQRDQVAEIAITIDAADPLDRALVDADRDRFGTNAVEHTVGVVTPGPMVRITNIARACEARGFATDGAIDLVIDGAPPIALDVRGGRCTVHASRGAPQIQLDRATFGAILYGALSCSDAVRLGLVAGLDGSTLRLADALFALPPYLAIDTF